MHLQILAEGGQQNHSNWFFEFMPVNLTLSRAYRS